MWKFRKQFSSRKVVYFFGTEDILQNDTLDKSRQVKTQEKLRRDNVLRFWIGFILGRSIGAVRLKAGLVQAAEKCRVLMAADRLKAVLRVWLDPLRVKQLCFLTCWSQSLGESALACVVTGVDRVFVPHVCAL